MARANGGSVNVTADANGQATGLSVQETTTDFKWNNTVLNGDLNQNPSQSRVTNGITLDSRLPDPVAGLDYVPNTLNSPNPNIANSHINGYTGELNLANRIADLPNQTVVRYGDMVGTRGADIVSVDNVTGEVTLWDNKFRSNEGYIKDSPTFSGARLTNARDQAERAIRASDLPAEVKAKALENLEKNNYRTNTAGDGNSKNSTTKRYCNNKPC